MGDAHFIEEQGGDVLATLYEGPIPRRGDELVLGDEEPKRYVVEAVSWVVNDGRAWARVYVEGIEAE